MSFHRTKMVFVYGHSVEESQKFMKECNEMRFYHHSFARLEEKQKRKTNKTVFPRHLIW